MREPAVNTIFAKCRNNGRKEKNRPYLPLFLRGAASWFRCSIAGMAIRHISLICQIGMSPEHIRQGADKYGPSATFILGKDAKWVYEYCGSPAVCRSVSISSQVYKEILASPDPPSLPLLFLPHNECNIRRPINQLRFSSSRLRFPLACIRFSSLLSIGSSSSINQSNQTINHFVATANNGS